MRELIKINSDLSCLWTGALNLPKSVLIVKWQRDVLGVKGKIMMLLTLLRFISELQLFAKCIRRGFAPTTISGISSIVNLKEKGVNYDTISCDITG